MDPKLESLLRKEKNLTAPTLEGLFKKISHMYGYGKHTMIGKPMNENSELSIAEEKIYESLKSYDGTKFKCEKVLEELKNQSILNEQETFVLALLIKSKECFENYEKCKRLRIPEIYKGNSEVSKLFERSLYLDWDGSPMQMWEWSFKKQYFTHHVDDTLVKGWRVSTVWLGLNHGWREEVQIFETMIFKEDEEQEENDYVDHYQERYASYDHALARHKEICGFLEKNKLEEFIADE